MNKIRFCLQCVPLTLISGDVIFRRWTERIIEKKTLLNSILRRIVHIMRRIYFLRDVIKGRMTEVK